MVQVTAKQFNWEIAYPGPDGKFGTADDVTMDNDLHVPVNKVVRIALKSTRRHPQLLRPELPPEAGRGAGPRDPGVVQGDQGRASTRSRAPSCAASATRA